MLNANKGIWDEAFENEVNDDNQTFNQRNYTHYHEINRLEVRNYMFSHSASEINKESLWNFFGPNIYNTGEEDGLYFTHYLFSDDYDMDKLYLAIEASFNYIGPNTGEIVDGANYLQILFLNFNKLKLFNLLKEDSELIKTIIFSLYELGIRFGLNSNYRDLNGNTILHYMIGNMSNFETIKKILNNFEDNTFNLKLVNEKGYSAEDFLLISLGKTYNSEFPSRDTVPKLKSSIPDNIKKIPCYNYETSENFPEELERLQSYYTINVKKCVLTDQIGINKKGGMYNFKKLSDVLKYWNTFSLKQQTAGSKGENIDEYGSFENFKKLIKK